MQRAPTSWQKSMCEEKRRAQRGGDIAISPRPPGGARGHYKVQHEPVGELEEDAYQPRASGNNTPSLRAIPRRTPTRHRELQSTDLGPLEENLSELTSVP